jgi:selenide,water dikinase
MCDPQTSGGLLVACAANETDKVLAAFRDDGFAEACVIGRMVAGKPRVRIR